MDTNTTVGILAWVFKQFGGRKMTIFLATWGTIIVTLLQLLQGHVGGLAATAVSIALAVLAALGVGVSASIAHEDGKKAAAAAMVDAATVDLATAQTHAQTAAIQAGVPAPPKVTPQGAAPGALNDAFKNPAMPG